MQRTVRSFLPHRNPFKTHPSRGREESRQRITNPSWRLSLHSVRASRRVPFEFARDGQGSKAGGGGGGVVAWWEGPRGVGRRGRAVGAKVGAEWGASASGGEVDGRRGERSLTRAAGCRLLESCYVARALPWPLLVCSAFVRNLVCAVRDGDGETGPCLSLSLARSLARLPRFALGATPSLSFLPDFVRYPSSFSPSSPSIPRTFSRLCSSPRFRQGASKSEKHGGRERERKSVRARFPTTPLRYVGERSRRLSAESACSALHMAATPHQLLSLPIALRSLLSCCSVYPRDVA